MLNDDIHSVFDSMSFSSGLIVNKSNVEETKKLLKLNKGQSQAMDMILAFLDKSFKEVKDNHIFCVKGGPGTGKTYMLKALLHHVVPVKKIGAATTSHSARIVLSSQLNGFDFVDFYTIASLLGMKPQGDMEMEDFKLNRKRAESNIKRLSLLIIDEVSMIHDEVYDIIYELTKKHEIKVIAIGDPYQLPPVGQTTISKFFDHVQVTLTEVMRFDDILYQMVDKVRHEINLLKTGKGFSNTVIYDATQYQDNLKNGAGYSFFFKEDELIDQVVDLLKTGETDINYARVLAFKNVVIDAINQKIREKLYGKKQAASLLIEGEKIISNKNMHYVMGKPVIYNGEILIATDIKSYVDINGIPVVSFMHYSNESFISAIRVKMVDRSVPKAMKLFNKLKQNLQDKVRKGIITWKEYNNIIGEYGDFTYANAVNVYKAQGQTIKHTFVYENEIFSVSKINWEQKLQALYVAITRASKYLGIYCN